MLKHRNPPLFSPGQSGKWAACTKCLGYGERFCEHCEGNGCSRCALEGHTLCTWCQGFGELPVQSNKRTESFSLDLLGDVF